MDWGVFLQTSQTSAVSTLVCDIAAVKWDTVGCTLGFNSSVWGVVLCPSLPPLLLLSLCVGGIPPPPGGLKWSSLLCLLIIGY